MDQDQLVLGLKAQDAFIKAHGSLPAPWNADQTKEFIALAHKLNDAAGDVSPHFLRWCQNRST